MFKNVKKAIATVLTLAMVITTVFVADFTNVSAASLSWNFKDSNFKDLGKITSTQTIDDLTLVATSSKSMSVKSNSQTLDGTEYTYALSLGGSGSISYRAVKVPVSASSTIKVTCMSSSSKERTLVIADENGKQLGTIAAGTEIAVGSYTHSGSAGYVYIYSKSSNVNIFKIQVDNAGSTTSNSTTSNTTTTTETTGSSSSTESTSLSWNFKDSDFKKLGTITTTQSVNNMTLLATSAKPMTVAANSQTVDGTAYTYALSLGGSGTTSYRAIKVPVGTSSTIKIVCKSSGSSARTLAIADESGKQLGTVTANTTAALATYNYSGNAGYVYIYSTGSNIDLFKVQVDGATVSGSTTTETTTESTTEGTTEGSTSGSTDSNVDVSGAVSTYSALVNAINAAEKAGGGTVYVTGKTIDCTGQIALSSKNANVSIVGVKNSDGSYPVLDFTSFRASYVGKSTSDSQVGIRISGSNYTIKNLIVEKAPDNGIQIKGSAAGNNTVENCIVRYNNDAGLQITGGAYSNSIKFVYSYRNCDVYTLGGNADGFAPKLNAGKGNTFYGCYAWDNSDDGWDSYDKTDGLTYDLSYEECACWNNGNPEVFTGQYDYENGNALDTDLLLVELIMAKDSSFASNYSKGSFSLPSSNFVKTSAGTISLSSWTGSNYDGNPNGFKFGSINTTSKCVRTVVNCLAFEHGKKGFDNNNSSCTATFTNCVAYDNGYNYYIQPFTIKGFTNCLSFSGDSNNKLPSGVSTSTPSSSVQSSIRSTVEKTRASIVSNCQKNIIPGEVYFDIYN